MFCEVQWLVNVRVCSLHVLEFYHYMLCNLKGLYFLLVLYNEDPGTIFIYVVCNN